jgi:hypothetical protein
LGRFEIDYPNGEEVDIPARRLTSSAVRATRAEEVSTTSAVGGGPGTSAVGEGSDTYTTGRKLTVAVT